MKEKINADMLTEKRLSGEVKFKGKLIRVERDEILLPNGNMAFREIVKKSGGVCIIPLTSEGEVIFVNQFRYPYGRVIKEAPAGKLERGEDPLECGIRELGEETGYTAGKIIPLGKFYPSPAIMDEVIYMYLATELREGDMHLDADEFLTNEKVPLDEAVQMILDGEISDGKTQAAILKIWALRQRGVI